MCHRGLIKDNVMSSIKIRITLYSTLKNNSFELKLKKITARIK